MRVRDMLGFLEGQGIPFSFTGDESAEVSGFSSLRNYRENTVTWAKDERAYGFGFRDKLLVVAQAGLDVNARNVIISEQSKLAFFSLVEHMAEASGQGGAAEGGIGHGTFIGPGVRLGRGVSVGHNCTIDGDVTIGDGTRIWHNVTIVNTTSIGPRCEIQSGCVIGHDGFAWTEDCLRRKRMVRHFGGVEIGSDVYIGPGCIIDRGEIDRTLVRDGARLDAGCFIAHNAVVGRDAVLVAGCRLYGSSEVGDDGYAASATIRNQCKVGQGAFIGMGAVVTRDIPPGAVAMGVPARVVRERSEDR